MKKQFEQVIDVLMTGEMVTLATIQEKLGNSIQMNRLSTYIWEIKKNGGDVEVSKEGKKVVGYRLKNPQKFHNMTKQTPKIESTLATKETPKRQTKAAKAKDTKKSEISSCAVENDFDAVSQDEISSIIGKI